MLELRLARHTGLSFRRTTARGRDRSGHLSVVPPSWATGVKPFSDGRQLFGRRSRGVGLLDLRLVQPPQAAEPAKGR
jgi:hypothetical protein